MIRRRIARSRGASMVEFLIVLPLFLFLFLAMVQFALVLHAHMSLAHATNVGARLASVRKEDADVIAAVIASASPTITLTEAEVTVGDLVEIAGTGDLGVPVAAVFDYPITLPFIRNLFADGTITLRSSSTMRRE